ncbi:MAG: glucuronate isomerase, partial [Verrucomicrobiota bacterium]
QQADLIWNALFVEHSPVSEACRGVVTTLNALGLDPRKKDLPSLRKWFAKWKVEDYIRRCMELGGVSKICMTNSPFDPTERAIWQRGFLRDTRFVAALRIDPLLLHWPQTAAQLRAWGYETSLDLNKKCLAEVRKFLADWSRRMDAQYLMVSLPPDFEYPSPSEAAQLIKKVVLPHCADSGLPFAMMPGVKRALNPELKLAGDGVGPTSLEPFAQLCAAFPENKFLITLLPRENHYELCVLARKFRNLHVFGCWWFTNIPYLIDELTRLRLELLGLSFTPQHSDARVLDQLVYKWQHSRQIIARVLTEKYSDLAESGWTPTEKEIQRDVTALFGGEFERFCRQS